MTGLAGLVATGLWPTGFAKATPTPRQALVVGVDSYVRSRDLQTPVHDAEAMASRLDALGFGLHGGRAHVNPDRDMYVQLMRDFAASVPENGTAFIYLAGHGVAQGGVTYLIPPDDEDLETRSALETQAVALPVLTARLAGRPGVHSLVCVDACRANGLRGAGPSVGGSGDLIAPGRGSMTLFYAASPGQIAADGDASGIGLSPFADGLLAALEHPSRPFSALFGDVSRETRQRSNGAQTPFQMQVLSGPALAGLVPLP